MTDAATVESVIHQTDGYLDQYVTDPDPILIPAFSVHGNRAWSVIPAVRKVTKKVGRGKEQTTKDVLETQMVGITSDHLWIPYEEQPLAVYGLKPHDKPFTPKPPFKWHPGDAMDYIRQKQPSRPSPEIYADLVDVFRTYVEYSHTIYYELMALFVLQTYTFTLWPATGYLHFNGTLSSGKSRSLDVIAACGYNGRQGSSFTPSTVYRMLEGNPGVICLDEQEMFKTDEQKEMYSNLLGGYRRNGIKYLNDNVGNDWKPTAYTLYSPKAIASINQQDATLASRSLQIPMVPAVKQPAELPDDPAYWRPLLHDLHVWALQNAVSIQRRTNVWNDHARFEQAPKLLNRAWEVARPYIVLADSIDRDLLAHVIAFFDEYFIEQGQRIQETDRAMLLLRCLPRVIDTKHPKEMAYYSTKDIHETVLDFLDTDQHEYFKTRHVITFMTTLRFTDRKTIKGGVHFRIPEDQIRETFRHRGIQPFEDDLPWFKGELDYAPTPADTQDSLESYLA